MSQKPALEGRWCGHCGGETRLARQMADGKITTFLICLFCGDRVPTLAYDLTTKQHKSLLEAHR